MLVLLGGILGIGSILTAFALQVLNASSPAAYAEDKANKPSSAVYTGDKTNESSLAVYTEDKKEAVITGNTYAEQFKIYEPFGLVYKADKEELYYNGQAVRWFEDYYPVGDEGQAGMDFFNENGTVDVYAVRSFHSLVRADDGSFDPSGELIGLKECSEQEFAARNVDAIKNPAPITATTGESMSPEEFQEMAKEYESFGVTYDAKEDQWYFNGEKVCYFRDILISNKERLNSGKFKGVMRSFGNENGTVGIYTIRDFENLNASGYGTLIGIEKYSQEEMLHFR